MVSIKSVPLDQRNKVLVQFQWLYGIVKMVYIKRGKVMRERKYILKRIVAVVLALFVLISVFDITSISSYAAGETYTIKASEIKTKESQYYHY